MEYVYKRLSIQEISGSLGDLGTLLPIMVGMSKVGAIHLASAFFWGGIFNIVAGIIYDSPIPIQPMKTIASASISGTLSSSSVTTSGFLTSIIVFFLGITKTIQFVSSIVPVYMISAIQLAQGLVFIKQGFQMISDIKSWTSSNDNWILCIFFGLLILFTWLPFDKHSRNRHIRRCYFISSYFPTALVLFIVGCSMASRYITTSFSITNPFYPSYNDIQKSDWLTGLQYGTVPQLPLTLLNSVLSVVELNNELFPRNPMTITKMAISVGFLNSFAVFFGAMPSCHGSGGLAGQVHFGAKTGLSIIILGIFKMFIGLFAGNALNELIQYFPNSILGLMLIISGGELASRGANKPVDQPLIFSIVVGIMISKDLYTGFLVGMFYHGILFCITCLNNKYSYVNLDQIPLE